MLPACDAGKPTMMFPGKILMHFEEAVRIRQLCDHFLHVVRLAGIFRDHALLWRPVPRYRFRDTRDGGSIVAYNRAVAGYFDTGNFIVAGEVRYTALVKRCVRRQGLPKSLHVTVLPRWDRSRTCRKRIFHHQDEVGNGRSKRLRLQGP